MNPKYLSLFVGVLIILLISACGPSAEEVATMTASAWTPTPLPTATPSPTPLPFDLIVKATDDLGNPIPRAVVALLESGKNQSLTANEAGSASWNNLSSSTGSLTISADGYLTAEKFVNLNPGPNEVVVVLERDPYSLLPTTACMPEEKASLMEDFQDEKAQKISMPTNWSIVQAPDDANNSVMQLLLPDANTGSVGYEEEARLKVNVKNSALRLGLYITGPGIYIFSWAAGDDTYFIKLGTNPGGDGPRTSSLAYSSLIRVPGFIMSISGVGEKVDEYLTINEWRWIEIAAYDGALSVWLDGNQIIDHTYPEPFPSGNIEFTAEEVESGAIAYYDNVSVCDLSAPFMPLHAP